MKELFKKDFRFWRRLINFWSVLFFSFIIYDFIYDNACVDILGILSAIYISILVIYVGDKEFERWHDRHRSKHPGEIFIIFWTILMFSLIVLDFILGKDYQMPGSVQSSYIAVLTILAVTMKSKGLHLYRDQKSVKKSKKK